MEIACNEYCALLDLDDFTQIKDLTRVKTGLTIEGIKILEDPYDKFGPVLEKLNESRGKIAKDYIEEKREKSNKKNNENSEEIETSENDNIDSDDISFLQYTVQILKEDYNLDSAGIYEFLKEVVDTKIGVRFRKKVWMEVENEPGVGTRYTRCLIVYIDDILYIIDVTKDNPKEIFRQFDEKELEDTNSKIIRFKEMFRNWKEDPYDGR